MKSHRRWILAAVLFATPVLADPPPPSNGGAACSFAGRWAGNVPPGGGMWAGRPASGSFDADGNFTWTIQGGPTFQARWAISGTTLTITSTSQREVCDPSGTFAMSWTPDCNGISFRVIADNCVGRRRGLDGLTVSRQR